MPDELRAQPARRAHHAGQRGASRAHGGHTLGSITVRSGTATETLFADALAVSGGWNPAVHLTCHLGGRPAWNEALAAFVPGSAAAPA